jgi:uncharacterized protein YyaL (SSP411 family)
MSNQLANETSPYLLLHKDNPVHWYPWGREAFQAAEASNKPILLSVGYTACHWCHVMNHESFADPETAKFMNEHFINIKVDREERPDVDQIYQAAANTLGHSGGWPLTMFLTPKGVPYFASTYSPNVERLGMRPFRSILEEISKRYTEQPEPVAQTADALMQQLNQLFNRDMHGQIDPMFLDMGAIRIGQRFDLFFGGPVGQMKFPTTSSIEVLWRAFLRTGTSQFMQLVSTTLDHMLLGGLCDHVGGGFARYTVDERWLVPHFEKMLYDNALILDQMINIWQFNRNPLCRDRIAETVAFLLRDMRVEDGFASSIDADSEGEEGKYYLWTEAEIDAVLAGTFSQKFKLAYNVRRDGNFQGTNILHRLAAAAPFPQSEADEAMFKKQRELLLAARQKRVPPLRDEKVLADWNGLTIASLANAGAVFQNAEWTAAAVKAFDFIVKALSDGDRLFHCWHKGKRGRQAFADDYAQMIRAATTLWELTSNKKYLDYAQRWARTLNDLYWDQTNGGYFFTSAEEEPLIVRVRMLFDQTIPSANGTMISQLARLFQATSDPQYAQRCDQLVQAFAAEAARAFASSASYFNGLDVVGSGFQVVIIGPPSNPKTHEFVQAVLGRSLPNRMLMVVSPDETLPPSHPAFGKTMLNGQPVAYVCQRATCSAPITNPVTLSQALQLPARPQQGQQIQ